MRMIISLSVMCLLLWTAFKDKDITPRLIGKTKLSYASHQKASILHISPQKTVTMDRLTVSAIKDRSLQLAAMSKPSPQPTSRGMTMPRGNGTSKVNQITGKLYLDAKVSAKFKASSTLFIIVRGDAPPGEKGPLIASTKRDHLTLNDFPLNYIVTQNDSMMGSPLSGKVKVSARLDQDGDAISREPGDIVGAADQAVIVGTAPVNITLDSTL